MAAPLESTCAIALTSRAAGPKGGNNALERRQRAQTPGGPTGTATARALAKKNKNVLHDIKLPEFSNNGQWG